MKKLIIRTLFLLMASAVLVLCASCGEPEKKLSDVALGDLSFRVDESVWTVLEQDESYYHGEVEGVFLLSALHSNELVYYTTRQFASAISDSQRERGYVLFESGVEEINGVEYEKRVFSDAEATGYAETYFVSVDYDYYSLTFSYTAESKADYAAYMSDVLGSLMFNYEPDYAGAEEAKRTLLGEWDCGEQGYMVFNDDGSLYWYKDGSKDPANVFVTEYGCDNKIKTVANGFKKGIYIEIKYKTITIDGKETEAGESQRVEIAMVPDIVRSDLYYAENITENASFDMKKIK